MSKLANLIENTLMHGLDYGFARIPYPKPSSDLLTQAKIISHRGVGIENTIPALEAAVKCGVWGVEFDIRSTLDQQFVLHHDSSLKRIFSCPETIETTSLKDIKSKAPLVPTLKEVLDRFGGKVHLMIEIKPQNNFIEEDLFDILRPYTPGMDYHLLCLSNNFFEKLKRFDSKCFFPVARLNLHETSNLCMIKNYDGFASHYFLMTESLIHLHHSKGQKIGTGQIDSTNLLYREISRGVDWIFSNRAELLTLKIAEDLRSK